MSQLGDTVSVPALGRLAAWGIRRQILRGQMGRLTSIEVCAGAGGQALGLEQAGFDHLALVECDAHACATLRKNRPRWNTLQLDLRRFADSFEARDFPAVDLLAGGVPCPPFSLAGRQLGPDDERDLFPVALHLVEKFHPRAVMLENVRGLLDARFTGYRSAINDRLQELGYIADWRLINASDHLVPQLRPRVICVALEAQYAEEFQWPEPKKRKPPTVGQAVGSLLAERGWVGAAAWASQANTIAPTLVGGSKKHGGPDLGPTRAKQAWEKLGVDGHGLADFAPEPDFIGLPRLTVQMAAVLQGFPLDWEFIGGKTAAYRQVGNAFPPPVAAAVAKQIARVLRAHPRVKSDGPAAEVLPAPVQRTHRATA